MIAEQYPGLMERSDAEKLQLAAELWQDVLGDSQQGNDPDLEKLVGMRLDEYRQHPDRVSSWDEVKARWLAKGV